MKSLSNRPIGYLLGIYHLADYISGWGVGKITRSGVDQLTAIKIVFGDSRGRVTVTAPLVIGSTSFTCSIPKYLLVNIDFRGQGDSGKKNRLRPNEALN